MHMELEIGAYSCSCALELENEKAATLTKNIVLLRSGLGNTVRFSNMYN